MKAYIVVIEDDWQQAEWVKRTITENFGPIDIQEITTEAEFRSKVSILAKAPPTLVIMDCMLRWETPGESMATPDEEVMRDKHYKAGIRCIARMGQYETLKDTPTLLYTVLEQQEIKLPRNVVFLRKQKHADELLSHLRAHLKTIKR